MRVYPTDFVGFEHCFRHHRPQAASGQVESECGITGDARRWLGSYFRDRCQAVYVDFTSSITVPLTVGFTQSSVIGPFGCKPFGKPVPAIARKYRVSIHLYVDDTQLYVPCDSDVVVSRREARIEEISDWMRRNNQKLNDSKTESGF